MTWLVRPVVTRGAIADDVRVVDPRVVEAIFGAPWRSPWRAGLRTIAALRRDLDAMERSLVRAARKEAFTWRELGHDLGVTGEAVRLRHASALRRSANQSPEMKNVQVPSGVIPTRQPM